ncbi:MAG: amidohydrolase [Clostridia bacterium]|nr:amidohydrolase [Clostridia bacterium]
MKDYKIIDFHIHPFLTNESNICQHIENSNMSWQNTLTDLKKLGYYKVCGSVIGKNRNPSWQDVQAQNDEALELQKLYDGFYIPGFHIHDKYVKESILEVERMHKLGIKLVGELVPYLQGWSFRNIGKNLYDILEACDHYGMIIDFHSTATDEESMNKMDEMVSRFKNMIFVGAHPSSGEMLKRAFNRMGKCENYYLDWSGGGLLGRDTLRQAIDLFGIERQVYGSDYPTCNPAMFVGGVSLNYLLSEEEKEYIFYKNASRLLGIE